MPDPNTGITPYDFQKVISAGAKPSDVVNYLAQQTGFNAMGAMKAGHSVNEVLSYMSTLPRKQAGDTSTSATDSTPQPTDDGSGIVDETNANAANIVEDLSEKPSLTGAFDVFGNIAGEAGDILGSGIKLLAQATTPKPIYDAVASALQGTVKAIAGTPQAQALTKAWGEFSAKNPDAAKDIGNAINIGALAAGGEAEPEGLASEVGGAVKQGASDAADAVGSGIKSAVKAPLNIAENIGTSIPENVKTILTNPTDETEGTLKDMFTTAKKAVSTTGAETPFDTVGKNRLGGALDDLNDENERSHDRKEPSTRSRWFACSGYLAARAIVP